MGDLLIKDISIPKLAGQVIEIAENIDGTLYARLSPGFDDWHQAFRVLPHGRLIDADKYEFPGDLRDEPTIIPASE